MQLPCLMSSSHADAVRTRARARQGKYGTLTKTSSPERTSDAWHSIFSSSASFSPTGLSGGSAKNRCVCCSFVGSLKLRSWVDIVDMMVGPSAAQAGST